VSIQIDAAGIEVDREEEGEKVDAAVFQERAWREH
jgi:hypothetical protein